MSTIKFHRVTALPTTLEASALYFVAAGVDSEFYITDNAASARLVINRAEINAMINSAMTAVNSLEIVADIPARDALALGSANRMVLVNDASADTTVDAGAALYSFDGATGSGVFAKIAEFESLDVVLTWASLTDGPASAPTQVDNAVGLAHSHTNSSVLDALTDSTGQLHYNGAPVTTEWSATDW